MARTHKYNAQRTEIVHKGRVIKCDSKAEAKRFGELILLERAKCIHMLEFHPVYELHAWSASAGEDSLDVARYVGDAAYWMMDGEKIATIVEDVKGAETETFKLKAKWFRACYPHIELRIVRASTKRRAAA